jgi:hypothetical protein
MKFVLIKVLLTNKAMQSQAITDIGIQKGGNMKKCLRLKRILLFAAILCFSISPAWGVNPGATLYVDASAAAYGDGTSWETAFTDLQDALDAAVPGDEIWVAAGTYKPTASSDRSVSFTLKSGVKIYGGFGGWEKFLRERSPDPGLTILSGDIGTPDVDTDNSYHVIYSDGVTDAVLDGFTVTRGYGDDNSAGAGMYNTNSALTIANCIFSNNKVAIGTVGDWTTGRGGGMYNKNSAPIVTNCVFSDNQAGNASYNKIGAGGGMYNEGYFVTDENDTRWPLVTGCTFRDNLASSKYEPQYGGGGGMYNNGDDCSPIIDRCTFERNLAGGGGGMLNYLSRPIITNCIFNTNSNSHWDGFGGAIYNMGSFATILNCTFYQNGWRLLPVSYSEPRFRAYTRAGGAVFDYRARSTIFNCIFSNNAVSGYGGAVVSYAVHENWGTTVANSFFYENVSWQGYSDPKDVVISHVYGKFHPDSVNNLYDIDPLLVDPAGGDFHLSYDSPCIDAGYALTFGFLPSPYPFGLPDTDFEGDKRIVDGDGDGETAIDIGVDEFTPNLPDLALFLQALADAGKIEQAVADRLLVYVDAAQAALDREEEQTAINLLNELIADAWASLDDTEIAQVIEMKTQAVIEEI